MAIERWITNLESEEALAAEVAKAQIALRTATGADIREAAALLHIAKYKQADVARSMRQIEMETNGRFAIGKPMATEFKTQDEISAQGIVGIYRQGAGDGP